jgi:hypothetical protein
MIDLVIFANRLISGPWLYALALLALDGATEGGVQP